MSKTDIYIEAHKRIEAVIVGMDMDEFDGISGTNMGNPSDDVMDAMYELANKHLEESDDLESEGILSKKVHSNLVKPSNQD